MIYLELFLSFLQMGLFGFGGGYAVLPLIKEQVVIQHPWLTMSEFTDLITISQMTPGADCRKFRYIYRIADRRCRRGFRGNRREYSSLLYYCYDDCKALPEIPEP